MSDINTIAEKIISKMPSSKDKENFGFVITVLMVISIVLTLIRILQECDKSRVNSFSQSEKYAYFEQQINEKSLRKTWFTKMIIKKAIRKELPKDIYKAYGVELMNAILSVGENLSYGEAVTLVESSNV